MSEPSHRVAPSRIHQCRGGKAEYRDGTELAAAPHPEGRRSSDHDRAGIPRFHADEREFRRTGKECKTTLRKFGVSPEQFDDGRFAGGCRFSVPATNFLIQQANYGSWKSSIVQGLFSIPCLQGPRPAWTTRTVLLMTGHVLGGCEKSWE